ncbi:MAG: hypothetical protein F6K42_26205 [Leptolyngbya sp. SIO1D8]|nr:hypothetical protein [Leptolyngbya sp. SIO1D8]
MHLTFPDQLSLFSLAIKTITFTTSAPFQVGYYPIRRVMDFAYLSADGFRFLGHPVPAREFHFGGPSLKAASGLYRGCLVPHGVEMRLPKE